MMTQSHKGESWPTQLDQPYPCLEIVLHTDFIYLYLCSLSIVTATFGTETDHLQSHEEDSFDLGIWLFFGSLLVFDSLRARGIYSKRENSKIFQPYCILTLHSSHLSLDSTFDVFLLYLIISFRSA